MERSSKLQIEQQSNREYKSGCSISSQTPLQRKPSPIEEILNKFFQATQSSFEHVSKQHKTISKNHDASIKHLEMQIGHLSHQVSVLPNSNRVFIGKTLDNPKKETCKALE